MDVSKMNSLRVSKALPVNTTRDQLLQLQLPMQLLFLQLEILLQHSNQESTISSLRICQLLQLDQLLQLQLSQKETNSKSSNNNNLNSLYKLIYIRKNLISLVQLHQDNNNTTKRTIIQKTFRMQEITSLMRTLTSSEVMWNNKNDRFHIKTIICNNHHLPPHNSQLFSDNYFPLLLLNSRMFFPRTIIITRTTLLMWMNSRKHKNEQQHQLRINPSSILITTKILLCIRYNWTLT